MLRCITYAALILLILSILSNRVSYGQAANESTPAQKLVVMLQTDTKNEADQKNGAGIIIGYDNDNLYVSTALHVVNGEENVRVRFRGIPSVQIGQVVKEHQNFEIDLAMIRVPIWSNFDPGQYLTKVKLARNIASLNADFDLYAIGNTVARVGWDKHDLLTLKRVEGGDVFLADNGMLITGYSGGGVFTDKRNRLLGMITEASPEESIALSIDRIVQEVSTKWQYPTNAFKRARRGVFYLAAGGLVTAGAVIAVLTIDDPMPTALIADPPTDKPSLP